MPNENLEAKQLGKLCFVWDCLVPDPLYPVMRRCPNGHTLITWYCGSHGPEMEKLAAFNEKIKATFVICGKCGCAMTILT